MNYKSFDLGDWIGHISGIIEDETTLDGNEMRDLVEFISRLPKWILVTERLPDKNGRYLCTYKNDAYGDGICIDFGLYEDGEWYASGVIAWMPLPKAFEGGTEE